MCNHSFFAGRISREEFRRRGIRPLDADSLKLCVVDDIQREIEESEEIFSRVSDVRREITKSRQNDKPAKTPVVTEEAQENPTITGTHGEVVEDTNINEVSIGGMSTNSSQNSSPGKNTPSFSRSKLPKLILPKFKGDIKALLTEREICTVKYQTKVF